MPKTLKRASPQKRRPAAATTTRSVRPCPTHDRIAARAYELFVERGGHHGSDWEDWLLAERELMAGVPPDVVSADPPDYTG
jgi:hypothetical protein